MNDDSDNFPELPEGWVWAHLEDLTVNPKQDIVDGPFGSNLHADEYQKTGIPLIRLQNIDYYRFINKDIKYVSEAKAQKLSRHSFVRGDIVITKLGNPLGKACIVPDFLDHGIMVADVVRARVNEQFFQKTYLMYVINIIGYNQLNNLIKGTTRPRVNLGQVRSVLLPIPPYSEQNRIVAKIEELSTEANTIRTSLGKVKPMLQRFRQSVLASAFRGELLPQDPNDELVEVLLKRVGLVKQKKKTGRDATDNVMPGDFGISVGLPDTDVPSGWQWVKLLDLADMASGHTPSRNHPEYWGGNIPWMNAGDGRIHDGSTIHDTTEYINKLGIDNSAAVILPENTVCLSRTGASIGYSVMLGRPMATNQGFVNFICGKALLPRYLHLLFFSERKALFRFAEGSAYPTIYYPEIKAFHILLPPIKEQQRILNRIDDLFKITNEITLSIQKAQKQADVLERSILSKAFRGELVPQDPNDEPASVLLERIKAEREKTKKSKISKK